MGRKKFSIGGGGRKLGAAEVLRFMPKSREARKRVTLEALQDIARAQALYDAQDWDACEVVIRRILKHGYAEPLTYDALGSCAQFQGRLDVALECWQKAIEVDPDYVEAYNRTIMMLDAFPSTTNEMAEQMRRRWWKRFGAPNYEKRKPHLNSRDPERPLRVGYCSADFQFHSAATVFHRIITRHTEAVQPFIYSSTPFNKWDTITNTYRAMPGWRDVQEWPDSLLANKIKSDEVDILVDLTNFTHHSRFQTFAYKPAPIQLSGWGYALATGFPCMDGLLTDRVVNPPETTTAGEQMVYLPSVIDYEPMEGLPKPGPLPCLTERPTFGVFQRSMKLNADDIGVWRQILQRLPESRLIVKSFYGDSLQKWIRDQFGSEVSQVEVRGAPMSSFDYKASYTEIDLSLDPWPQNGGVSACDSLHMGVPYVTLLGERAIQRSGASLLTSVGLTDCIAHSKQEYVDKAVAWVTTRKDELAYHRATLRDRLAASPICAGYLEATESAYRDLWRDWCAKPMTLTEARYRLEMVS